MTDYSKMATEDFDRLLIKEMERVPTSELLAIPGCYEVMSEHFNNDVLTAWEEEQKEEGITVRLILMDETDHWDKDFLAESNIKSVFGFYVYDPELITCICSQEKHYFLRPVSVHVDRLLGDEEMDSVETAFFRNTEDDYYLVREIEKIPIVEGPSTDELKACQWSETFDYLDNPKKWWDEVIEELHANTRV